MPFLRNLAIKRKLMFLMMGTSTLALLLASMAFIGYEWYAFRNELVHDLKTQAEIIAANSSAALSFEDHGARGKRCNRLRPSLISSPPFCLRRRPAPGSLPARRLFRRDAASW